MIKKNKIPEGYKHGFTWDTKKEAIEHVNTLRHMKGGIPKKVKVNSGVFMQKTASGKYSVYYRESKSYNKFIRTGRD
jgi:hypothetical protein